MIRAVVEWESLYEVSSEGNVWTLERVRPCRVGTRVIPRRIMKPTIDRRGYAVVVLKSQGRRVNRFVHHLVLEAFRGPCPEGMQCRHLNGDPTDNRLENLAWGTSTENAADRIDHDTQARGEAHGIARLTEAKVREIRQMCAEGASQSQIADAFGIGRSTVQAILSGRTWRHVGAELSEERHNQALSLLAQWRAP